MDYKIERTADLGTPLYVRNTIIILMAIIHNNDDDDIVFEVGSREISNKCI